MNHLRCQNAAINMHSVTLVPDSLFIGSYFGTAKNAPNRCDLARPY
jgi:hypothetical protein